MLLLNVLSCRPFLNRGASVIWLNPCLWWRRRTWQEPSKETLLMIYDASSSLSLALLLFFNWKRRLLVLESLHPSYRKLTPWRRKGPRRINIGRNTNKLLGLMGAASRVLKQHQNEFHYKKKAPRDSSLPFCFTFQSSPSEKKIFLSFRGE